MDSMDLAQIHKKLQTDWAAWTNDGDHQCITVCKKELMEAMQTVNAYLVSYDIKTKIEQNHSRKVCEFCGQTYNEGAEPVCLDCLLTMKIRIRRLSCLLDDEDLCKVLTNGSVKSVM
jgi:hypothetical protein